MKINEITNLISLRDYVANALNGLTQPLDRPTGSYLQSVLLLLDNKIISEMKSDEFKELIHFNEAQKAREEAARITNIRSGLKK